MKVIIIEDEKLSAELLSRLIAKIDPAIEILTVLDSVKRSVEAFQSGLKADLIFLDIHLADGISFELFSQIALDIPVIFTTAYSEYAIKAFEVNSVDYLLKPIGKSELSRAIDKFKKYNKDHQQLMLEQISNAYQQINKQYKSRFMVKVGATLESIRVEDILHFITHDGLTFLTIANGKRYPVDYTLDQLEALVSSEQFFRINRKVILSLSAIGKISTYVNSRLVISSTHLDGESGVVSRERVNDFKAWLDR